MEQIKLSHNPLVDGPLTPSLLKFTLPFFLSNILQTLYGMVDTLVIGNFGTTAGVSAVATGAQVLCIATFFCFGLCGGSTVLLGQHIGAKNDKEAAKVVGDTIIDFTVISIIMTILGLIFYPWMLKVLNLPEEALSEAHRYMRICCAGIPMIIGYNTVGALLRAIGDSKSPLLFVFVACIINIIGDVVLTGVFHMGAAGVAIATVLAQGFSFLFSLVFVMKKGLPFAFHKSDIRFHKNVSAKMARIGLPMGMQSILVNLSFLFMTSIINSMGVSASAAMGIGDKIIGFAFMPQNAFGAAIAVVVSQNIGAGKPERALSAMRTSIFICLAIEIAFFAVCQIWPEFLPGIFTRDSEVVSLGGLYMKAYSYDAVMTAVIFCMGGYLNGRGWTGFNLLQNLLTSFLVRIPAAWLLTKMPGTNLFYIGLAAPASSIISIIMLVIYVRYMLKKNKDASGPMIAA